jgi:hypothetical protein
MQEDNRPTIAQSSVAALKGLPKYIFEYTVGLLIAVVTDFHITTLALAGAFVGLARGSVLDGVATFFVIYSLLRIVGNLAEAVGINLRYFANTHGTVVSSLSATLDRQEPPVIAVEGQ